MECGWQPSVAYQNHSKVRGWLLGRAEVVMETCYTERGEINLVNSLTLLESPLLRSKKEFMNLEREKPRMNCSVLI